MNEIVSEVSVLCPPANAHTPPQAPPGKSPLQDSNLESDLDLGAGPTTWDEIQKKFFSGPGGFDKSKEVAFTALTKDTRELWMPRLVPIALLLFTHSASGEALFVNLVGEDCYGVRFILCLDFRYNMGRMRRLSPEEYSCIGGLRGY